MSREQFLAALPSLAERVTIIPVYSDATMLLHRTIYGVRGRTVKDVYVVEANGLLQ